MAVPRARRRPPRDAGAPGGLIFERSRPTGLQGKDPSANQSYNLLLWRIGLLTQTNSTC
jgi:hypothetical protein